MAMNFFIHAFMYGYYTLRALNIKTLPVFIPYSITVMQLSQMAVGVAACLKVLYHKNFGEHCQPTYENVFATLAMYTAYLLLFVNFFYQSYYGRRPKYVKLKGQKKELEEKKI